MLPQARNKDSKRRAVTLLLWIALIVIVTVPWYDLSNEPRWRAVAWLPFVSRPWNLLDVLLNFALYVPFGYWLLRQGTGAGSAWKVVAAALLLSAAAETSQVFSHRRIPSMTDLVTNAAGAWAGTRWARSRLSRRTDPLDPSSP